MEKDRLPHWDLSEIYPSPESGEFKADLKKVYELRDEIMENLEDFSIKKLIDLLNDAASLCSNLSAYSSALLSTDTSNSTYLKAVGETEDAEIAYEEAYQAFIRSASKRSDEFSSEDLEDYKLFLSEIITLSTHQMSDAEERLAQHVQVVPECQFLFSHNDIHSIQKRAVRAFADAPYSPSPLYVHWFISFL